MDFAEYKEHLFLQIQSTARRHAEKYEECPEDGRNALIATALSALADRFSALPPDHPDIRRLWDIEFGLSRTKESEGEDQSLGQRLSEILDRYGLDDASEIGDPEQFLSGLVSDLG